MARGAAQPPSETSTVQGLPGVLECADLRPAENNVSPLSVAVLAFGMSADACAAAMARGASTRPSFSSAIKGGLVFGAIETLTPILGWALGLAASGYVAAIDHWVAFGLLAIVGGKMTIEGAARIGQPGVSDVENEDGVRAGYVTLVLTAIATSIDAAAVGVTLALVSVNIVSVALAIGLTTFVLATAGMLVGRSFGARFGPIVELIGGIGLIAIGTGILMEHTGLLG